MLKKNRNQILVSSRFQTLGWRLLLSYLAVMVSILGTSGIIVYQFFAQSLYQQVDQRLLNLAQSASHSLEDIKQNQTAVDAPPYRKLDDDGDLDIPWKSLRLPSQSVEWFDHNKVTLASSGVLSFELPLEEGITEDQTQEFRILTISVYSDHHRQSILEGYIRVSESIFPVENSLNQLRWGLTIGGLIALGLVAIGGMWLTNESIKPVEESYQQLKQFTADASHELRSPLTVIRTSVEVMQSHPDRIHPADLDKLKGIMSATNQMSHLVEDLLILARNDGIKGNLPQNISSIPLNELLEDLVEFLEPKAEAKNINLLTEGLKEVFVFGDVWQLSRLFSNLLNNALQYTPVEGTIVVSMTVSEYFVTVSVKDTGIGIAPAELPFIFERFWRADQARTSSHQGSGLGLAIAKAIAERHQGKISVKSQLGLGSCFQVRLPRVEKKITSSSRLFYFFSVNLRK